MRLENAHVCLYIVWIFLRCSRSAGSKRQSADVTIYLDNNATTKPLPSVRAAMDSAIAEVWQNPSSIHRPGQAARQRIELARKHCADLIGTRPRFITFVGSGTEAIDLGIRGALLAQGRVGAARKRAAGAILISPVEHIAIRELAKALEREEGVRTLVAEVDAAGVVSSESVERLLRQNDDVTLVSVQWANNEVGTVQPVREIAQVCREAGVRRGDDVLYHCDATQWIGKMEVGGATVPIDEFDLLTYSPHKFHGPKGVGVLYARAGVRTAPLIHGEQELGRRGGTENVAGIVGAGVAAQEAMEWLRAGSQRAIVSTLRDRFERGVLAGYPDARVNGAVERAYEPPGTRRLWNTTSIGFRQLEAEALLLLLSERGVCCSAGAACSSGSLEASAVIKAMRVPDEFAHGTLRFSLSRETTLDEVDQGIEIVVACAKRLRESML